MMFTTILLGLGLSMDCVAVLLSLHTIDHRRKSLIHYVLPVMFGISHTILPFIGWALGYGLKNIVANFDHWIAFILLLIIGARMVKGAGDDENSKDKVEQLVNFKSLVLLSLATGMDAVVIGMTFVFLDQPVVANSLIIGATTLAVSLTADIVGDHVGPLFKNKKQGVVGGIVIMAIGVKILLEHLLS